ncbi:mediator complex subunit MED10, putative [Babesia ovis]|uniref:Mediator of RNA polymerase II transcription subunit 10 n=1 Tax=Babesia ovis TaxID=5869 RepID=A0A9W5WU84_BABOV|nr:mediator complex subunit MED10, putative [Babesia ovis]
MKDTEDSSSNDESAAVATSETDSELSALLLDVVERLTKIAVLCESPSTADSASVKSLVKHTYKFERALRKLQNIVQQDHERKQTLFKGVVRAVDDYMNPYDWARKHVVDKYRQSGMKLDAALEAVDELQKQLIDRLQVNDLLEPTNVTE